MKLCFILIFLSLQFPSIAQIKPFTATLKDLALYKGSPSSDVDAQGYIEIGDTVQIISIAPNGYYKVKFKDKIAYMQSIAFVRDSNLIKAEKLAEKLKSISQGKEAAARKASLIKKYGVKYGTLISQQEICLGMTSTMARASWGEPKDINRSVGKWGVYEQWVYSGSYLYFENGRLTSWQD